MAPPPESNDSCDFNNLSYSSNATVTMNPGVYCGTTELSSDVNATLNPGTYVFRGGPLDLSSNVSFAGSGVMIYMMDNAYLDFSSNTNVALSAPTTGPYAGILLFGSRSDQVTHMFNSASNSTFNGTVYLPTGTLEMNSDTQIASGSDYSMFIVRKALLSSTAHLVINSNFAASSVPLPAGITIAGVLVR